MNVRPAYIASSDRFPPTGVVTGIDRGEGTIEGIGSGRVRLPLLRPAELTAAQMDLYTKLVTGPRSDNGSTMAGPDLGLPGPFNAMLFNPDLGDAVQGVGLAIRFQTGLSDRVRELAILAVAAAARCDYERIAHSTLARRSGLDEDQIAAVCNGQPIPRLSPEEIVALGFVEALVTRGDADDAQLNEFVGRFGFVAAVELIFLVGYYQMLARSLRVWRIDNPAGPATLAAAATDETTGTK